MGGDAFANTDRLDRAALLETLAVVADVLQPFAPQLKFLMPPELTDKESFGDVDLLLCADDNDMSQSERHMMQERAVRALFERLECVEQIGHRHLLTGRRFQVDLEFLKADAFPMAAAVFSHGDFAWIVGLSLREHGLKLTEAGLFARRDAFSPTLAADVLLSQDPAAVCAFLGLPEGFMDGATPRSSDEVFAAVARGAFFARAHFRAYEETDTCETRRRNRKRPMLARFQQWLMSAELPEDNNKCDATKAAEDNKCDAARAAEDNFKCDAARAAAAHFGCADALDAAAVAAQREEQRRALRKRAAARVNGARVLTRAPDLPGVQVGRALKEVGRSHASLEKFALWAESVTDAELDAALDAAIAVATRSV